MAKINLVKNRSKRNIRYPVNLFCEGAQEELYFERLRDLIKNEPIDNIKKDIDLNIKDCKGGNAEGVALIAEKNYNPIQGSFVTFDHDLKPQAFEQTIDICSRNKNLKDCYSNLNFDLWLILHKTRIDQISMAEVLKNNAYETKVRELYGLNKEEDIKNKEIIRKILNQIYLADVKNAILCGERMKACNERDYLLKKRTTKRGKSYYLNPDLSIHKSVKKILQDVLVSY